MKQLLIGAFAIVAAISTSCTEQPQKTQTESDSKQQLGVLVNMKTYTGTGENSKTKDSGYYIATDYFEIGLYSLASGKGYIAEKQIEEPTSLENFRSVSLNVVDSSLNPIIFGSSTDFLNFMSEKGYSMKEQTVEKQHTDFVFVKK